MDWLQWVERIGVPLAILAAVMLAVWKGSSVILYWFAERIDRWVHPLVQEHLKTLDVVQKSVREDTESLKATTENVSKITEHLDEMTKHYKIGSDLVEKIARAQSAITNSQSSISDSQQRIATNLDQQTVQKSEGRDHGRR